MAYRTLNPRKSMEETKHIFPLAACLQSWLQIVLEPAASTTPLRNGSGGSGTLQLCHTSLVGSTHLRMLLSVQVGKVKCALMCFHCEVRVLLSGAKTHDFSPHCSLFSLRYFATVTVEGELALHFYHWEDLSPQLFYHIGTPLPGELLRLHDVLQASPFPLHG